MVTVHPLGSRHLLGVLPGRPCRRQLLDGPGPWTWDRGICGAATIGWADVELLPDTDYGLDASIGAGRALSTGPPVIEGASDPWLVERHDEPPEQEEVGPASCSTSGVPWFSLRWLRR